MATFYIRNFEINDHLLKIETGKIISSSDNLQIILQDRKSKKEFYYKPELFNSDDKTTIFHLNLSSVNFPIYDKNVFDLYFVLNAVKYRVRSNTVFLKNENSRFSTNLFKIDNANTNVAVPYVTIKNNLSILYGNPSIIFEDYCIKIESREVIHTNVESDNQFYYFELQNKPFQNLNPYLAYYNETKKKYESVPYSYNQSDFNTIYVEKRFFKTPYPKLTIQYKNKNNLLTFPMAINESTISDIINLVNKPIVKNHLTIENVSFINNIISFEILKSAHDYSNNQYIYFKNKQNDIFTPNSKVIEHENSYLFQVDLEHFTFKFSDTASRWGIYLEVEESHYIEINRLGMYNMPVLTNIERYFYNSDIKNDLVVTPYFTVKNGLSIIIKSKAGIGKEILQPITSVKTIERSKRYSLYTEMEIELNNIPDFSTISLMLKYRNKTENIEYYFETTEEKITKYKSLVKSNINVKNITFETGYWDIYLIIQINNQNYIIRTLNPEPELVTKLSEEENKHIINLANRFILYPYITGNEGLSITYRTQEKQEGTLLYLKEKIAFSIYTKFKNYFDNKMIWLIYEKFSQTAQDNSYYFFKYVYENHPEVNIYYVIDKNSPDYKNVKGMSDRVVSYLSIKHLIYMIASKLFVSSESKGHAYILKKQNGRMRNIVDDKIFIFLRHGVTALKNVNHIYKKDGKNNTDLIVASSQREKEIVIDNMKYDKDSVMITGLCRWDALIDKSKFNQQKEITIMPTWRNWLDDVSQEMFLESDYYKHYTSLVNSDKLKRILLNHNIILHFFIHPKFKAYINNFSTYCKNIKIYQFGEVQVNNLLMRSSLLITDYSSVAWDFYYLKKPVIFYQFDFEMYNKIQGSYIDMKKELFGDRVLEENKLMDIIEEYVERNYEEKEQFANMRDQYFQYVDQNNSERVFDEIMRNKKKLGIE